MQRLPIVLVENLQLPAAYAAQYTAPATPANALTTINAATLNNTTGSPVTVSISIVPAAGSQAAANEIVSALSIPATGTAPTVVSALIGMHLSAGETLQMKASSATAITARICGYQTVP